MSGAGFVMGRQAGGDPAGGKADEPSGSLPLRTPRKSPERNRRTFTKEYKLGILSHSHELRTLGRGRIQAMLRQEGLRTSHLAEWKKQLSEGRLGQGRRGRPERSRHALQTEIRRLKHKLVSVQKRCHHAERLVMLQVKYVQAASVKLARKDRGLLSTLIAQIEDDSSIAAACHALGLNRPDFYRTIKPRRKSGARKSGSSRLGNAPGIHGENGR